jgi:hypothetical protein
MLLVNRQYCVSVLMWSSDRTMADQVACVIGEKAIKASYQVHQSPSPNPALRDAQQDSYNA